MRHDLRDAVRRIRQRPAAALVAVLTIAIGVGANAAIFSIIRAVFLAPLPYAGADRLVALGERWPNRPGPRPISMLNYRDWAAQNTVFERIAAATWGDVTVGRRDAPIHVDGSFVSPSYFDVFGLRPALGRTFAADEDRPGRNHVVVLSHRLWMSELGGDPAILGTSMRLDGERYTVVGVMPPGASVEFGFDLSDPQLWRPWSPNEAAPRGAKELRVAVARMKRGVTLEQARAQMETIADRLARQYPDTNAGYGVVVRPLPRPAGLAFEASVSVLFAASAVVLLLACVNLANLALARGAARAREIAIRTALGAGRAHLVRQFLAEQLLVALAGGACGAIVSYGLLAVLRAAIPTSGLRAAFPAETTIRIDVWVWLFAFMLAALCGIACGLAPAIGVARRALVEGVRLGGGGAGIGRAHQRLQRGLVVAQIALAFALLIGTGLLLRSFLALTHRIDAGFDAARVLTARLPIPETRFASGTAYNAFLDRIADGVRSLPGVRDVAFADAVPTEGAPYGKLFHIVGQPAVPYASRPICGFKVVSPSYFSAVRLRVLQGRALVESDRGDAPLVAVINHAMAETWFRDGDPIGRRMLMRRSSFHGLPDAIDLSWTVVGVIADEGVSPVDDRTAQPMVYVTREQHPRLDLALVVRTTLDPVRMHASVRSAVAAVDPDQAVMDIKTVGQLEADDLAPDRLRSIALSVFAATAIVLAALGLYGVIAHAIVQRTRELGIRAALGATPADLLSLILRHATAMIGAGLVTGFGLAFALTRLLSAFLFGVRPSDPATAVGAAALLSSVALLAAYVPARRATRIDPLTVLRSE